MRWEFVIPDDDRITGAFEVHSRLACEGGLADTQPGGMVTVQPVIVTEVFSDANATSSRGTWLSTQAVPHPASYIDSTEGVHIFTQPFDIDCTVTGDGAASGQLIRVVQKVIVIPQNSCVQFQYESRGTFFTPAPAIVLYKRIGRPIRILPRSRR